jgi:hypothetical protein
VINAYLICDFSCICGFHSEDQPYLLAVTLHICSSFHGPFVSLTHFGGLTFWFSIWRLACIPALVGAQRLFMLLF